MTVEPVMARIQVRLQPRASANAITGVQDGVVRVRVTAPPIDNAANDALTRLLAKTLKTGRGSVSVVRGRRSRTKLVEVAGLTEEEALMRLDASH